MNKAELIALLKGLNDLGDEEVAHGNADHALIEFINDPEIAKAYAEVHKWYA